MFRGNEAPGEDAPLYPSDDDDDWGLSAAPPREAGRPARRAFWDQAAEGGAPLAAAPPPSAGGEVVDLDPNSPGIMSSQPPAAAAEGDGRGLLRGWEREAPARERVPAAPAATAATPRISGGDRRRRSRGNDAYMDVDEDIRHLDTSLKGAPADVRSLREDVRSLESGDNAKSPSLSSPNMKVQSTYKEYLKSIRDEGFENYLASNTGHDGEWYDLPNFDRAGDEGGNAQVEEFLERVLDAKQERRPTLYGDVYGVRDMRTAASPYLSWQARAPQADGSRPSLLERWRRRRGGARAERGAEDGARRRGAPLRSPRVVAACLGVCFVVFFAAATAALALRGGNHSEPGDIARDVAVPLETSNTKSVESEVRSEINRNRAPEVAKETYLSYGNVEKAGSEESTDEDNAAAPSQDLDEAQRETAVIEAFRPSWFSAGQGWSGGSYRDAVLLCETSHMILCPYAAYCPNGNARPTLSGSMVLDADGEEWAPVNGPANSWIQIGTVRGDEGTRCAMHHDILGDRPSWGMDRSRTDSKHHILCCLV